MIARTQSVWTLAQKVGLRSSVPAISGEEQLMRKPGRRLTSSAGIRAADSLLSPPRLSMTIWLRKKNKDTGRHCQFGLEGRIKKRRVFGNGPTVLFSETTYSQHGQLLNQTTLEEISTAWSSGTTNGMTMCAKRKTTLSAQSNCVLQVNFSSVMLRKNIAKGTTDPRVEFILQDHSSRFTNLEHITVSDSQSQF